MNNNSQHNTSGGQLSENLNKFLEKAEIPYKETKEEVWNRISSKIDNNIIYTPEKASLSITIYLIAATIALFVFASFFAKYYTKTIYCPSGEHLSLILPDQSEVVLNAGSSLKHNPLWWHFSRRAQLDGEAYFSVTKGSDFSISSNNGITTVLGTTFNIYARGNQYEVTCVTGSIKVESTMGKDQKILKPKEKAIMKNNGLLYVKTNIDTRESTAWKEKELIFTGSTLYRVLEEIGRQFDVLIKIEGEVPDVSTTFNTLLTENVENVLFSLCEAHGFTFEKNGTKEYIIKKK